MYDEHINRAAIAAAHERHRQCRLRLEGAEAAFETAAAAVDRADDAHFEVLVAGTDPTASAAALAAAEKAARDGEKLVAACREAVRRDQGLLHQAIGAAMKPAAMAAETDLMAAAKQIDDLRTQVRDTLAAYRQAAIASSNFNNQGCSSAAVNASAPWTDDVATWAGLPADRSVVATVIPRLRNVNVTGVA